MLTHTWLDVLPLWAFLVVTLLLVLAAIEIGYRYALRRKRHLQQEIDSPVSSVVGGMLGLLAFLLAFTFAMTSSRFDKRKELLLEEVTAIERCHLRAGLTPEPVRDEIRARLREYVHLRADIVHHPEAFDQALRRSDELLAELWERAQIVGQVDGEMSSLFVESLGNVIEVHRRRIVVSQDRIPNAIWLSLYVLSTLTMVGVGYQFGLAGVRDLVVGFALALAFSIVIWLIASLERSYEGALQVNQRPMVQLDHRLGGGG
jgi:hypothetical protein